MTDAEVKAFAEAIGSMLMSHVAHGLALTSVEALGEITLRDGLVVAAAAAGAKCRQAWIIDREIVPNGWTDAPVDILISREGNGGNVALLGGIELKWWRRTDAGNAGNRRRDLVRDFLRAAALYRSASTFSFVALVATKQSWDATTNTTGSDRDAMTLLAQQGSQRWNVRHLRASAAIRGAASSLRGHVDITSVFHSELLCASQYTVDARETMLAKVWLVKKPQNSIFLDAAQLDALVAR